MARLCFVTTQTEDLRFKSTDVDVISMQLSIRQASKKPDRDTLSIADSLNSHTKVRQQRLPAHVGQTDRYRPAQKIARRRAEPMNLWRSPSH